MPNQSLRKAKRPGDPADGIVPPAWRVWPGHSQNGAATTTRHAPSPANVAQPQLAEAWHVVVLDDPVNLMSYVVMVFKKVLGFDEARARRHMLEVHEQGRSIVWSGQREQAEAYAFTLQRWHLTAVIEANEAR